MLCLGSLSQSLPTDDSTELAEANGQRATLLASRSAMSGPSVSTAAQRLPPNPQRANPASIR
jgi:hypothetical protein